MLLNPDSFTVGASGAIFGLFGAVAVIQRASGASIWASGIGQVLAINLLFTFLVPRISVGGHLGGLLAGVAVGAIYIGMVRARQNAWVATAAAAGLGGVLLAAIVFLAANPIV
jgi:membrane associated rhomboid family serine protease